MISRVIERTIPDGECIRWVGGFFKHGYPRMDRCTNVRRAVYEDVHGPIAKGIWIGDTCGHRWCVNIDHLFAGTPRQVNLKPSSNSASALAIRRTHCNYGHRYDTDNFYIHIDKKGRRSRVCKECCARKNKQRPGRKIVDDFVRRCPHGHLLTPATIVRYGKKQAAACRACLVERKHLRSIVKETA